MESGGEEGNRRVRVARVLEWRRDHKRRHKAAFYKTPKEGRFGKMVNCSPFHRTAPGPVPRVPRVLGRVANGSDYARTRQNTCEQLGPTN